MPLPPEAGVLLGPHVVEVQAGEPGHHRVGALRAPARILLQTGHHQTLQRLGNRPAEALGRRDRHAAGMPGQHLHDGALEDGLPREQPYATHPSA